MASLTLTGIPDDLLKDLRRLAEHKRRSLNQQAILLLERALDKSRLDFTDVYRGFVSRKGESPLRDEDFSDLRSKDKGRNPDLSS